MIKYNLICKCGNTFESWYSASSEFDSLVKIILEIPTTFVHRDFHSRNLMITDSNNPGVLDYQDALIGPIT